MQLLALIRARLIGLIQIVFVFVCVRILSLVPSRTLLSPSSRRGINSRGAIGEERAHRCSGGRPSRAAA